MVAGRDFDPNLEIDKRESILINESAAEYFFGTEDPVGKKLPGEEFGKHTIIGVTKDFNFQSLHTQVEPLVISQNSEPITQGISDLTFDSYPIPKVFLNIKVRVC